MKTREQHQANERKIVELVIDDALKQGYRITVYNGGEDPEIALSDDRETILENMFATDEDRVEFTPRNNRCCGFVLFVYGNDDYEVINDHTGNWQLAAILKSAFALAEQIENEQEAA